MIPKSEDLPDHVMVDSFIGSLSAYDAAVARKKVESKEQSESLQVNLLAVLSGFECREVPKLQQE